MTGDSTEDRLHDLLGSLDYEATNYITQTGCYWINKLKGRHLLVPNSADGWYPSWMIDELAELAKKVGDDLAAATIKTLSGDNNETG